MDESSDFRPLRGDSHTSTAPPVAHLVQLLAEAARSLALKGFAPEAPSQGTNGCSLTIRSEAYGLEARLGFSDCSVAAVPCRWASVITSGHSGTVAQSGSAANAEEAAAAVAGFVSVISTVASFRPE